VGEMIFKILNFAWTMSNIRLWGWCDVKSGISFCSQTDNWI